MIDPFAVVALSPRTFTVKDRGDALENVKRINQFMDTAVMVAAWEGAPVKLVVIPEMAIQGMIQNTPGNREREAHFAVTIPGPETDELGKKARELNTYIAGELYMVKDPDFEDRYFNVAFIIDPQGDVRTILGELKVERLDGGGIAIDHHGPIQILGDQCLVGVT